MAMSTTTKLMAINTILSGIGEAPVNNLNAVNSDVRVAEAVLDEISREVQSTPWHFNTDEDVELHPDSTGNINLASNVVRVDLEGANVNSSYDVVIRGSKLFNRKTNSYTFSETLKYTTVSLMEWDYLPETVKRYIMIRATRVYQDRVLGSEKISKFTRGDEMTAFMALREFEMDTADYSIFDNYDVARIVDRTSVINRLDRA